jgi:hypothetical protein
LFQQLVQLVAELALQVFDTVIDGMEVPELFELVLKCPQRLEVLLGCTTGLDVSILEERIYEWFAAALEPAVCNIELFFSKLAGLGEEQADEDIAAADSLVVLILQASIRHGVKEVFPSNDLKIEPFLEELVIPLPKVEVECVPIALKLGGSEKEANLAR